MAYNLLIVDDSSIVRKVIQKTLGMTDLQINSILEAGNGKEALEILKDHWVDLVFLDINMPVMNGMEFMEHLRANPDLKDLPVLVVSTEGSVERRQQLERMNIKAYLRKPVTPETLSEAVKSALNAG